jgi:hypothetical protein
MPPAESRAWRLEHCYTVQKFPADSGGPKKFTEYAKRWIKKSENGPLCVCFLDKAVCVCQLQRQWDQEEAARKAEEEQVYYKQLPSSKLNFRFWPNCIKFN